MEEFNFWYWPRLRYGSRRAASAFLTDFRSLSAVILPPSFSLSWASQTTTAPPIGPHGALSWDKVRLLSAVRATVAGSVPVGRASRRVRATKTVTSENELSPHIFQYCTDAVLQPWTFMTQFWLSSVVSLSLARSCSLYFCLLCSLSLSPFWCSQAHNPALWDFF